MPPSHLLLEAGTCSMEPGEEFGGEDGTPGWAGTGSRSPGGHTASGSPTSLWVPSRVFPQAIPSSSSRGGAGGQRKGCAPLSQAVPRHPPPCDWAGVVGGSWCHPPGIKLLIWTKRITDELINKNLIIMCEAKLNCLSLT